MTLENESASVSTEPVSAIKRELEKSNVRFESVFARREEIVVVLPGRGRERETAQAAASKVALQGRYYVTIMAEDGAPASLRMLFAVLIFAVGLFGTLLMLWGYIGAAGFLEETPESAAPAATESR